MTSFQKFLLLRPASSLPCSWTSCRHRCSWCRSCPCCSRGPPPQSWGSSCCCGTCCRSCPPPMTRYCSARGSGCMNLAARSFRTSICWSQACCWGGAGWCWQCGSWRHPASRCSSPCRRWCPGWGGLCWSRSTCTWLSPWESWPRLGGTPCGQSPREPKEFCPGTRCGPRTSARGSDRLTWQSPLCSSCWCACPGGSPFHPKRWRLAGRLALEHVENDSNYHQPILLLPRCQGPACISGQGGDSLRLTLKNTVPLPKAIFDPPIAEKENFPGLPLSDAAKTSNILTFFEKKRKKGNKLLFSIFLWKNLEKESLLTVSFPYPKKCFPSPSLKQFL